MRAARLSREVPRDGVLSHPPLRRTGWALAHVRTRGADFRDRYVSIFPPRTDRAASPASPRCAHPAPPRSALAPHRRAWPDRSPRRQVLGPLRATRPVGSALTGARPSAGLRRGLAYGYGEPPPGRPRPGAAGGGQLRRGRTRVPAPVVAGTGLVRQT